MRQNSEFRKIIEFFLVSLFIMISFTQSTTLKINFFANDKISFLSYHFCYIFIYFSFLYWIQLNIFLIFFARVVKPHLFFLASFTKCSAGHLWSKCRVAGRVISSVAIWWFFLKRKKEKRWRNPRAEGQQSSPTGSHFIFF